MGRREIQELQEQCQGLQLDLERAIEAALDIGGLFDVTQNGGESEHANRTGQQANAGTGAEAGSEVSTTNG
jgi:hypothetical protein